MFEGLGMFLTTMIVVIVGYLLITAILLPHYVRQIKNDVKKISDHIVASKVK